MKPTQEQVIAWAQIAGLPRLEATDEIFCLPSAIGLAALAYEAGRKDENEACAKVAETPVAGEQDDITMEAKDRIAAVIRARREQ